MSKFGSHVSAYLYPQLEAIFGDSIEYRRGASSATVTARAGKADNAVDSFEAIRLESDSREFVISVAALAAFGEPQKGDVISQVLNGTTYLFKVLSENKQPCFSHEDEARTYYRIRTKQTGTEGS